MAGAPGAWVGLRGEDDGQDRLTRSTDDAEVVDQRPVDPLRDAAVVRGGRARVVLRDDGVQVLDCADWTVRPLTAT